MRVLLPWIVTHSCAYSGAIYSWWCLPDVFCQTDERKENTLQPVVVNNRPTICKAYSIIRRDGKAATNGGNLVVSAAAQNRYRCDRERIVNRATVPAQVNKKKSYGLLCQLRVRRRNYSVHHKTRQVNSIRLVYPWTNVRSLVLNVFSLNSLLGWL